MDVEEYEKYVKIERYSTAVGVIVSILLNLWVISSLLSDLLGIKLDKVFNEIIKHGWQLPPNWVQQYQPYLYTMQWVLLFAVLIDTVVSSKYTVDGEPRVPLNYQRVMSFVCFFCGMWLYLAYHVTAYGIIFLASFVTFMWSMFAKPVEEGKEEEEETESEFWLESATT